MASSLPALPVERRGDRLDSLTGLRFFAALLVVLYHAVPVLLPVPLAQAGASLGFVGVTFFFVLSGFVLTWSYRPGLAAFYWRRVARIYPLHVLSLAAALVVLAAQDQASGLGPALANLLLVHAWVPDPDVYFSGNSASWSLSNEAFFYAVLPALLALLALRRPARPVLAVSGVVAVALAVALVTSVATGDLDPEQYLYVNPLFRAGEFVAGVLLALAFQRGWRPPLRTPAALALAAGALVLCVGVRVGVELWREELPAPKHLYDLAMVVPFGLLIAAAADGDRRGAGPAWPRSRTLVKLGEWSFALYLAHTLLILVLEPLELGSAGPAGGVWLLLYLGGSLALAALLHELVERPAERWLRQRGPSSRAGTRREPVGSPP